MVRGVHGGDRTLTPFRARFLRPLRMPFRHMDMLQKLVSPEGVEPSRPVGHRFSACYVCHSATVTWCGAWGSNPPEPARRAGALPESELRVLPCVGGAAVSRTRSGLHIGEPRLPNRPTPMCLRMRVRAPGIEPGRGAYKAPWPDQGHARTGTGRGSRTHTEPLLRRRPPAIGLYRRESSYGTRGSNPAGVGL